MNIVFSSQASQALAAIGDYIAKDNPHRAYTFMRELRTKARKLSSMPRIYPLVPRYERQGIRCCPHGNYLIFYRVEDNRVIIVHILHGARDYEALLFPEV